MYIETIGTWMEKGQAIFKNTPPLLAFPLFSTTPIFTLRIPDYTHYASTIPARSRNNFIPMPAASIRLVCGTEVVACVTAWNPQPCHPPRPRPRHLYHHDRQPAWQPRWVAPLQLPRRTGIHTDGGRRCLRICGQAGVVVGAGIDGAWVHRDSSRFRRAGLRGGVDW